MTLLILGLVLFIGAHAFTMARGPRARLIGRIGEGPYKGLYSLLSLAGVVLISIGYADYRANGYIPLWNPPIWTQHIALVLVWFGFVFFSAAYLPGRIRNFAKRHPMLLGLKIWAFAHLLANGDLGSLLLFGGLLAWGVAARISVKRRDEVVPHGGPTAPAGWRNDLIAVAIGTVAYLAFAFWLHPLLIGVPVLTLRG